MVTTPKLLFPTSLVFSTNLEQIQLSGTADVNTFQVLVNTTPALLSAPSPTGFGWSLTVPLLVGDNLFKIFATDSMAVPSIPLNLLITRTTAAQLGLIVDPPSGLSLRRHFDSVDLINVQNLQAQVIGYNYYVSQQSGGGIDGYRLINTTGLVTNPAIIEEQITETLLSLTQTSNIRTKTVQQVITLINRFSFTHQRAQDSLITLPASEDLFYVITAVARQADGSLVESPFSAEIATKPLILTTNLQQLPVRTQSDVAVAYISRILAADDVIDVKPLTFTRDVVIDPPSEEFQRLYLILDFIHRAQSFQTLLQIDDANNTGVSDPVLTSSYKNALRVALLVEPAQAQQIQDLIDSAFTKLAKNSQVTRRPPDFSVGEVTVYTTRLPATDRIIVQFGATMETRSAQGTNPVQFVAQSQVNFFKAQASNFFNAATNRFEFRVRVKASVAGANGNVEAGSVTVPTSGVDPLFRVNNDAATQFGTDIEANRSLAERALLAFVSVDSGTAPGYRARLLSIPGIFQVRIQQAGDRFMKRDFDPLRQLHIGGKVDAYIQSLKQTIISDTFSFSFKRIDKELVRIKDLVRLQFSVQNPLVTANTPVFEVIEVLNASRSQTYDLTNLQIQGDGNVIVLDPTLSRNIALGVGPDDVVYATYRFRQGSGFKFRHQPVISVSSVVGNLSGALPTANYLLLKKDDPLDVGNSIRANDSLQIIFTGGLPQSGSETVTGEQIFLVGGTPVEFVKYGVQLSTLVVTDTTGTIIYIRGFDYEILEESTDNPKARIFRLEPGRITSGTNVLANYKAGENFTVTYTFDDATGKAQTAVDTFKHATADAIVKQSPLTTVDLAMTVVLNAGANRSVVNNLLRTNVSRLIAPLKIGQSLFPSDVIAVVRDTPGVNFVVVPMTKMVRADGVLVIREPLIDPRFQVFQTGVKVAYQSQATLLFKTTVNGGPSNRHRGVFEDDVAMNLVTDPNLVSTASGQAFIGADGTLTLSTRNDDNPANHTYTVSYIVQGESGQKSVSVSEIEKIVLGRLDITFG